MDKEEMKHLKRNLEVSLQDLDKSKRETEELKEKLNDTQLVIKRLRKDLKEFSTSDLGIMVKKMNEENTSLKEQLKEFDDKLSNNKEVYDE